MRGTIAILNVEASSINHSRRTGSGSDSPDLDGKGEGGAHSGLGVAADIVGKAVVEDAVVDADGLLGEGLVHGDGGQLQRAEPLPPGPHRRGTLRGEQIHHVSIPPSPAVP